MSGSDTHGTSSIGDETHDIFWIEVQTNSKVSTLSLALERLRVDDTIGAACCPRSKYESNNSKLIVLAAIIRGWGLTTDS